eukprot:GDKJ01043067.1.p1 GENE.GDKJ01043067.1~~GDKJ01043067.1.p1  ORF type:complete len:116 (-),score=31.26 GDKJ01043067.1:870-1217(-)
MSTCHSTMVMGSEERLRHPTKHQSVVIKRKKKKKKEILLFRIEEGWEGGFRKSETEKWFEFLSGKKQKKFSDQSIDFLVVISGKYRCLIEEEGKEIEKSVEKVPARYPQKKNKKI